MLSDRARAALLASATSCSWKISSNHHRRFIASGNTTLGGWCKFCQWLWFASSKWQSRLCFGTNGVPLTRPLLVQRSGRRAMRVETQIHRLLSVLTRILQLWITAFRRLAQVVVVAGQRGRGELDLASPAAARALADASYGLALDVLWVVRNFRVIYHSNIHFGKFRNAIRPFWII